MFTGFQNWLGLNPMRRVRCFTPCQNFLITYIEVVNLAWWSWVMVFLHPSQDSLVYWDSSGMMKVPVENQTFSKRSDRYFTLGCVTSGFKALWSVSVCYRPFSHQSSWDDGGNWSTNRKPPTLNLASKLLKLKPRRKIIFHCMKY